MSPAKEQLMSRLELLPDRRLSEVLDFVEFIASRRDDSDEPLLNLSGILKATPLSAEALEAELYESPLRWNSVADTPTNPISPSQT